MQRKRIFALFLTISMVLIMGCLSGCSSEKVTGKGNMVKRPYDVGSFDSVEIKKANNSSGAVSFFGLGSDFEIIYKNGQENKVELEAQENLFDYIQVRVEAGTLILENSQPIKTDDKKRPKLYVTMPQFNKLTVHGGAYFKDADKIQGEKFDIDVSGFCEMDLDLDVNSFGIKLSNDGTVKLRGSAKSAKIDLSGIGKIEAKNLDTVDADVNIGGMGDCEISCSGTLKANASDGGTLRYKGDPELTENNSGILGTIEKVN
ncbi:MAG: DUF2807 domain-containing protein [Peptococcaceae bacterium]|nr:DUF2807 domain-containing protein [Peptococcaceae bacterium]